MRIHPDRGGARVRFRGRYSDSPVTAASTSTRDGRDDEVNREQRRLFKQRLDGEQDERGRMEVQREVLVGPMHARIIPRSAAPREPVRRSRSI
jgi:hypothetical protein